MLFRKSMLVVSLVLASFATSCTTRYQELLRDRDERINELNGQVARLRGENEELQRRSTTPAPVEATTPKGENPSLIDDLSNELGSEVNIRYSGGRISMGIDNSVTFDSGSTALKDTSHRVLRKVATTLKERFSGHRFYIEGHTDSDPIQKTKDKFRDNRHLSMERADAVRRYLVQQGVPDESIAVVGYGQFAPVDRKNKDRNRRVEIVVGETK